MKKAGIAAALVLTLAGCTIGGETPTTVASAPEPALREEQPSAPATVPQEEPEDAEFVRVLDWIPDIVQDLKYAGEDNFTGEAIYSFWDAYLRYGTVKKLALVQQELQSQGLGLKIWDGFRPVSAQWKLWQVCPDANFVANPETGYSKHSRGNTVDLTLVDSSGRELEMPTGFDDFSAKADRDYSDCTPEQAENALILEAVMQKYGFTGYFGEWWHFEDTDTYPVEEQFEPPAG